MMKSWVAGGSAHLEPFDSDPRNEKGPLRGRFLGGADRNPVPAAGWLRPRIIPSIAVRSPGPLPARHPDSTPICANGKAPCGAVFLEAPIGIEPMDSGFAVRGLTTWLRRLDI